MVVLNEQIDICAPYEKLAFWVSNFEEEFVKWSPYHIECELFNGGHNVGDRIRFREIVMNLDYNVTGTIIESEEDENHFRFVFQSDKKTAFITFEGKRTEEGCHFSHTDPGAGQASALRAGDAGSGQRFRRDAGAFGERLHGTGR